MSFKSTYMIFGPADPSDFGMERDGVEVSVAGVSLTWKGVMQDAIDQGKIERPGVYFIQADNFTPGGAFVRVEQPPVKLVVV